MPGNKQLQLLIENIAHDHDLSKEQLERALVDALKTAAKKSATRPVEDVDVEINKGDIRIIGKFEVVDVMPRNPVGKIAISEIQEKIQAERLAARISVERERRGAISDKEARKAKQELLEKKYAEIEAKYNFSVGDIITWEVTPANFGRVAANEAKRVIGDYIRKAEHQNICDRYKKMVGQLVQCTYLRSEREKTAKKDEDGNEVTSVRNSYATIVLVDDQYEAIMPSDQCIPGEKFDYNERFRAILLKTNDEENARKYVFTVSRACDAFLEKIMEEEVTEIADGSVEIRDIARAPGNRSKVIVSSNSKRIDPIGACLGRKGIILKNITNALRGGSRSLGTGERVDIIRYSDNFEEFAKAVLKPAEVESMDLDDTNRVLTIRVPKGNHSKAIGINGRNVSLAGAILRCKVIVLENDENALDNIMKKTEPAVEEPVAEPMPEPTPEFLAAKERAMNEFKLAFGINDEDAEKLFVTGHMIVDGIESDLQELSGYGLSEDALEKISAYFGQALQD